MSHSHTLLDRNRAHQIIHDPTTSSMRPRLGVCVIACLDARVEPSQFLGVVPGDAAIIRNAGGRVTDQVLLELAIITHLGGPARGDSSRLEVMVVHHTDCGTRALVDSSFSRMLADRIEMEESDLVALAVVDPVSSVIHDVERIRHSTWLSPGVTVSGHVYDVENGKVATIMPAGGTAIGGGRS